MLTRPQYKNYRWNWFWNYSALTGFHHRVTAEEGAFWFAAMAEEEAQRKEGILTLSSVAKKFAGNPPSGPITAAQMHQVFSEFPEPMHEICLPLLLSQLSVPEIIEAIFEGEEAAIRAHGSTERIYYQHSHHIVEGFRRWVRPLLTDSEVQEVQDFLRPRLDLSLWPASTSETPRLRFALAAVFGMSNELRPLIKSWADDAYQGGFGDQTSYHRPQDLIFGLSSAQEVEAQMRRLGLLLQTPPDARAWLAHTEFSALDTLQQSIASMKVDPEKRSEALFREMDCIRVLEVLGLAEVPETAPVMLELAGSSLASATARRWLDTHTAHTVTGLLPLAGGDGPLAEPARVVLSGVRRRGQAALIAAGLAALPPDAAKRVRTALLSGSDPVPFDDSTTPKWLRDAPQEVSNRRRAWWRKPSDLPFVSVGPHCLNDAQTETLLEALAAQKKLGDPPHPFILAVRAHADTDSLDLFVWRLFERWHLGYAPCFWKGVRWNLMALGLLGGDGSARKLTPIILAWSSQNEHTLAALGLDVLRIMGTEEALQQLREIAQNAPLRRLKSKASACLDLMAPRTPSHAQTETPQ